MKRNTAIAVARQAWRSWLTTGTKESAIGEYKALVCITENNGDYVVVTSKSGSVQRCAARISWSR